VFRKVKSMFALKPMPALRSLAFLTLCFALSACSMFSVRPVLTAQNSPCMSILLASGLLDETPGADKSLIDGTGGGLGAYAIAEAGQRVKANIDKATAKRIGTKCDAKWAAALAQAKPRRKFLGIF